MSRAQMKRQTDPVSPQRLWDDLWAAGRTYALKAAIDLDVFTAIAERKKTAADIAKAVNASRRGVECLLDLLVGLGHLMKKANEYVLTPASDAFLVRTGPSYLGNFANQTPLELPGWESTTEIIRTGRRVTAVDTEQGREFFPQLVRAIFPVSYNAGRSLVQVFPQAKLKNIRRVLDVAAGTAAWSLPFAQAVPGARVTVVDYPEVTPVAREYAERLGAGDRYDYLEGDLRQIDFGQKAYDVVILGHIIHSEGEKWGKDLIKRSFRALTPGGTLVIAEMIPNDTRTGPVFPLLFALNMILHTNEGNVFTLKEYRQWLKQAGFTAIRTVKTPNPSPVILATR